MKSGKLLAGLLVVLVGTLSYVGTKAILPKHLSCQQLEEYDALAQICKANAPSCVVTLSELEQYVERKNLYQAQCQAPGRNSGRNVLPQAPKPEDNDNTPDIQVDHNHEPMLTTQL